LVNEQAALEKRCNYRKERIGTSDMSEPIGICGIKNGCLVRVDTKAEKLRKYMRKESG
jgi:hypothetical protein